MNGDWKTPERDGLSIQKTEERIHSIELLKRWMVMRYRTPSEGESRGREETAAPAGVCVGSREEMLHPPSSRAADQLMRQEGLDNALMV